MKSKFFRTLFALVLALSLSTVMAVPAAAHTSTATVAFHVGASQLVGEDSVLDVVVTNALGSLGIINEVKIDFSATEFTSIGKGVEPTNWTGVVADSVITYTAQPGAEIAADDSLTFYPTVANPAEPGVVDPNPTVTTSDPGNQAVLTMGTDTSAVTYTAVTPGTGGHSITVDHVDPSGADQPLDVSVAVNAITVSLATDVGSVISSTADDVAAAVNEDVEANLLVVAVGGGVGLVVDGGPTLLADGEPQVDNPCTVTGELTIKEFAVIAEPTDYTSATATDYVISFTTLTEIVATTGRITITFPSGYDISDLVEGLAGDISMTVAAGGYTPSAIAIDAGARTVTITADAAIIADKAVVVTAATHVKNPPTSDTYAIAVLTSGPDDGSGEVTIVPYSFSVVAGVGGNVTAGTAFAVTVTTLNEDEGTDTGYAGSYFIDFAQVGGTPGTIPAFELISFTAGEGTSPANFILTVAGEAVTITAGATEPTIDGESATITINTAGLVSFTIEGEVGVVAGVAFATNITVTAYDAEAGGGNVKTDYVGMVTWTSAGDELAELPAAYTFTETDAGIHVFLATDSEFTLKTAGTQTITVADEVAGVEQESGSIVVTAADAMELEVEASPSVIIADNIVTAAITVTALDEFGNTDKTYSGTITIESSLGTIAVGPWEFTLGVATTTLKSDKVGTATIKVTGDFDPVTAEVKLLPDIVDSITVAVDKYTILNNGADERTITATYDVLTVEGADYKVTFSTTPSAGVTLSETEDDPVAGVATTTLTTTIVATETITVTATGAGLTDESDPIDVDEGTSVITLHQGWNLISLPLVPTAPDILAVLEDLIADGTVIQVRTYDAISGTWPTWASTGSLNEHATLTMMEDGPGFWIEMSTGDDLVVSGSVHAVPPATMRSYTLYEGWNLIGFKSLEPESAQTYLDLADEVVQAMYEYIFSTGAYDAVAPADMLASGVGYWIALSEDGVIFP